MHWRCVRSASIYYERLVIVDNSEDVYNSVLLRARDGRQLLQQHSAMGRLLHERAGHTVNVGFFNNFQRTYDQKAAFGFVDFDLIPKELTVTLGTRYYRNKETEDGGNVGSFNCEVFTPTTYFGPCLTTNGTDLNTQAPNSAKYTGFRSRANLSWQIRDHVLMYYTWSQGYSPGRLQ